MHKYMEIFLHQYTTMFMTKTIVYACKTTLLLLFFNHSTNSMVQNLKREGGEEAERERVIQSRDQTIHWWPGQKRRQELDGHPHSRNESLTHILLLLGWLFPCHKYKIALVINSICYLQKSSSGISVIIIRLSSTLFNNLPFKKN